MPLKTHATHDLASSLLEYAHPRFEKWRRMPFLSALEAGTLAQDTFRNYLEQDFVYLRHYARLYSALAAIAPDAEVEHFIGLANGIVTVELDSHRRLGNGFDCDFDDVTVSDETRSYMEFLTAHSSQMGEALVAMLPCVAGYGIAISMLSPGAAGPYAGWLAAYTSGDYQGVIDRHLSLLNHFDLDPDRAIAIIDRALDHEDAFWNQLPLSQGPTE
jgi:thiaminase/transcriptional activator TenA